PLSAVNVVRFLLKPGQAALAGELPLAWQPGLGGGVQLLELPLLPAADQAARRELVAGQLDDFILASQRRFNAPPAAPAFAPAPV
ncbi:hypothetical protein ABTE09_20375, partial [Acinetobacter baumannii]